MDLTEKREAIGRGLGRIPSGCAILTARAGERRTGMLASWIQQAGFEPPAFSVAVKKGRPIEGIIEKSGMMVVNLLGEDDAKQMFRHFGKGFDLEDDAFAGLACKDVEGGVEIDGRLARLSGRVKSRFDAGDHWLYVAEVVDAAGGEGAPYVHLRKSGMTY